MSFNSHNLQQFIAAHAIDADIVHLDEGTPTVASAAAALGVTPRQIIKSVLFLADDAPVLVITNGLTRIHRKRLADTLGTSRRRVKIADAAQVQAITGYPVGAVPPFGHPQALPTLLDMGVLDETAVYGGGGELNALLYVTPGVLQRVTQAQIVDIADR